MSFGTAFDSAGLIVINVGDGEEKTESFPADGAYTSNQLPPASNKPSKIPINLFRIGLMCKLGKKVRARQAWDIILVRILPLFRASAILTKNRPRHDETAGSSSSKIDLLIAQKTTNRPQQVRQRQDGRAGDGNRQERTDLTRGHIEPGQRILRVETHRRGRARGAGNSAELVAVET